MLSFDEGMVMNSFAVIIRAEITFHDERFYFTSLAHQAVNSLLRRAALMMESRQLTRRRFTPASTTRRQASNTPAFGSVQEITKHLQVLWTRAASLRAGRKPHQTFDLKN